MTVSLCIIKHQCVLSLIFDFYQYNFCSFNLLCLFFFFLLLFLSPLGILPLTFRYRILLRFDFDGCFWLLHILHIYSPTWFRCKFRCFLISFHNKTQSGELTGAIADNLGARDAKCRLKIHRLQSCKAGTDSKIDFLPSEDSIS